MQYDLLSIEYPRLTNNGEYEAFDVITDKMLIIVLLIVFAGTRAFFLDLDTRSSLITHWNCFRYESFCCCPECSLHILSNPYNLTIPPWFATRRIAFFVKILSSSRFFQRCFNHSICEHIKSAFATTSSIAQHLYM